MMRSPSAAFCTAPAASSASHVNQKLWIVCVSFRNWGNGTLLSALKYHDHVTGKKISLALRLGAFYNFHRIKGIQILLFLRSQFHQK